MIALLATGAAIAALAMLSGWAVIHPLMREQGRLLVRIDEAERRLALAARRVPPRLDHVRGLEIGAVIPDFELHQLSGQALGSRELLQGPAAIINWDPRCRFCEQIAPELSALAPRLAENGIRTYLISRGSAGENARFGTRHGLAPRLLVTADPRDVTLFREVGTPAAYLIDQAQRIASPLAVGVDAVLYALQR